LVHDIFTLLQTGSGKTYTMGTGSKDGYQAGIVPQVMSSLFSKIETLKNQIEFQLHVSFIEVRFYFVTSYSQGFESIIVL